MICIAFSRMPNSPHSPNSGVCPVSMFMMHIMMRPLTSPSVLVMKRFSLAKNMLERYPVQPVFTSTKCWPR